ncbi:DUF308 domain-containing protein [Burkholderia sp. Ap-962]|uniref:DUF308 domain-containing protein n=1 Tax=Burkholderia sp. Ap-962 TaxID=2608333 RepID=UPI001422BA19|nr:DUF308 domain-containing protein [Burkholderia sp. Ap-962]NIF72833.1 DUF308 domain-containing protein [Burkholderia sp. Ap-962]
MSQPRLDASSAQQEHWLKRYYFSRALFSVIWVALAFAVGRQSPAAAAVLLVIYPAWDALANFVDLSRSGGGMSGNPTQASNVAISALTTVAVLLALGSGLSAVLTVFGVWAILSGLLQLGTAIRRWRRFGAQWAMVLSGAQSALAGTFFIVQSEITVPPPIVKIAGYAAVGAVYFLISAVWLQVKQARRGAA